MYFALIGPASCSSRSALSSACRSSLDIPSTVADRTGQHGLSTGIGSLLSERAHLDTPGRLYVWATLLVFFVLLLSLWFPVLVHASEGMGLHLYARWYMAAIVPAGAMMGFGFPTGMRLVNAIDRRPTPWF